MKRWITLRLLWTCLLILPNVPSSLLASPSVITPPQTNRISWIRDFTIITAGGYKDNVTLANQNPPASPFIFTSFEAFFARLPNPDRFFDSIDGFAIFDDRRYTGTSSVEKEQLGFVQGSVGKTVGNWHGTFTGQYIYQDQVVDVSLTEANLSSIKVLGHAATIEPALRRDLNADHHLELTFPITRQFFEEPLDDYWSLGPRLELVRSYGYRSRLELRYEAAFRSYDSDEALDTAGFPLAGTDRKLDLHEARVLWRHYWDAGRRWRTSLKAGYKWTLDHAGGYFNYQRPFASVQLLYRAASWEVSAESRFGFYHYTTRTAVGSASNRERTEWGLLLRAEKEIRKYLVLFAEYEYDQTRSNDSLDEFDVNSATGGLRWQF